MSPSVPSDKQTAIDTKGRLHIHQFSVDTKNIV